MSALDEPVVAWTAALIDGEGSIMLNRMASGLKTGRGIRYRPVGQPGFLPANRPTLVEKLDAIYKEIRELNTRGRKKGGHQ